MKKLYVESRTDLKIPYCNQKGKTSNINFSNVNWVHRVNSIERYFEICEKYNGIEIDVNFDSEKNCFDVYHAPKSSVNLCLEEMLKNVKNPEKTFYWLDFKNLDSTNYIPALNNLNSICEKLKIKNNLIVESSNPVILSHFTDSGFYTSYYIFTFNPYALSDSVANYYYEKVCAILDKSRVCAISGYAQQLVFMKHFPGYDFLLWNLESNKFWSNIFNKRYKSIKNVKVILVKDITKSYI
ncbi:MAG: hypothetical protein PHD97_00375 [Bacteroidales bacterium]|nr:hypothetical protein [Bacteroidales bacterium]